MTLPFYPRSCGVNRFVPGESEDYPPLNFVEICWVNRGCCRFDLGKSVITASAGECLYRLAGDLRCKQALGSGPTEIYCATFDGPGAVDFLNGYGYPQTALRGGVCPIHLFERISRKLMSPRADDYAALTGVYAELLARMTQRPNADNALDRLAEECLYQINANYENPAFNINVLAEKLQIHRSSVHRAVRRATGDTPQVYLNRCRMEHALMLLENTILPISEIAWKTGFNQVNYFCSKIQALTGVTPQEYRNRKFRETQSARGETKPSIR